MSLAQAQKQARILAEVRSKLHNDKIGQAIEVKVFGRFVTGEIIAIHPFGVVDVKHPGGIVRVSGVKL